MFKFPELLKNVDEKDSFAVLSNVEAFIERESLNDASLSLPGILIPANTMFLRFIAPDVADDCVKDPLSLQIRSPTG